MVCGAKYGMKWVICPTKREQTRRESVISCSLCGDFVPSKNLEMPIREPFSRYFVTICSVFVPRSNIFSSSSPKDEDCFDRLLLNRKNKKNRRIAKRNLLIMKKSFSFRGTNSDETGHFWNRTGLFALSFGTFSARLGQKRSRGGLM